MENIVFVYVDKPRIDAFVELLTVDGYSEVFAINIVATQYFSVDTRSKLFMRMGTCAIEKTITVEDFIDLFI